MEILRVARTCGLPPGLHVLDDVLLEFHLSRPGPSSHRIAALLDPVAGRPELLRTLRTHLAQHQDRRLTAALLGLHPNTVDNRLAKLTELTGLDPSSPRGAALAIAALLLRDTAAGPDGASAAALTGTRTGHRVSAEAAPMGAQCQKSLERHDGPSLQSRPRCPLPPVDRPAAVRLLLGREVVERAGELLVGEPVTGE